MVHYYMDTSFGIEQHHYIFLHWWLANGLMS